MSTEVQNLNNSRLDFDVRGEIAYNAYCETRDWKSFNGQPLPRWDGVTEDIKRGWREAVKAVINSI